MSSTLVFSEDYLTADHPYARPHVVAGQRFHGGFLNDGRYAPPRTLNRLTAVEDWSRTLTGRGWPLIDCSPTERALDAYPNLQQQRLLLEHGLRQALWDEMTIIAVNEGRGEAMCYIKPFDLQSIVEEDLSGTVTGHLWKGLFWAHGVDEAGNRATPDIGGHKHMWLAARDLLLGADAYPPPHVPPQHSRPKNGGREAPILPAEVETIIEACMSVLHVECRAYPQFNLCLEICRDPSLFDQPAENVALAAEIISRIKEDETSHVAYLRGFVSELRSFSFLGAAEVRKQGAEIIDPIWERQVAWPNTEARDARRAATRQVVENESHLRLGDASVRRFMERFDALATHCPLLE